MICSWALGLLALLLLGASAQAGVIDDLRQAEAWQASASDQVQSALRRDRDGSLCLDYDFKGVSGYAVMRRELPITWPAQFELVLQLKTLGARNEVQLKWVDSSGDNVWWARPAASRLSGRLTALTLRRRHIHFAWGPTSDKRLSSTRYAELVVVAAEQGGRGSLCVAQLSLQARAPDPVPWPEAITHRGTRHWQIDWQTLREFNGLTLRWPAGQRPLRYTLRASDDGRRWRPLRRVNSAGAGVDGLFLPESQARLLRLQLPPYTAAPQLRLFDAAAWPDFNAVISTLAAELPRGDVPRAWRGEQNHWTLVGVDGGGARSALISEDGAIEIGRGGFSVEPVLWLDDGSRVTWADVTLTQSLPEQHLPLPLVQWQHASFTLEVQAAADGPATAPELLARYTLHNRSQRVQHFTLALALRPWQVNPPQQFLSTPGGAREVTQLRWDSEGPLTRPLTRPHTRGHTRPHTRPHTRSLQVGALGSLQLSAPAAYGALPFDRGLSLAALRAAPAPRMLVDPQRHASALLRWQITLQPGQSQTLGFTAALVPRAPGSRPAALSGSDLQRRFDGVAQAWRARLGRVALQVPPDAQPLADSLRSALAHMLLSRDGAALRPGTRSYARTWVRDGAMMVAALLRLGEVEVARQFVDWYAGHVFVSGKVPCCVDARGADPVVENDSHGQFLFAVAEVLRATGDSAWAARHWGTVQRVTAWMEGLRQSERGAHNLEPGRMHLFGLMPPSISHEGYSDKPAYSLWDDFWALRGYKDAVFIAQTLGHAGSAQHWSAWRDEFERELAIAIIRSQQRHGIDFIPGAADRGDFDATSTTVALDPAQATLPDALLQATFERYWQDAQARGTGQRAWADYTPYEWRNVGALVRLGQVERAHSMLRFFFQHQRPPGWNQWAEVVLPDAREPRFLGDMPHAWVSSDFIRSALDLFVYDDEAQGRLLLGAGWPAAWLDQRQIGMRGVHTAHGPLDLSLQRTGAGWLLDVPLPLQRPGRQLVLRWPVGATMPRALHQGHVLAWQGRDLLLPAPPLRIELLRD